MKSKYNQTKPTTAEKQKVSNSYDFLDIIEPFDFVGLYKTAAETNKIIEKYKTDDSTLNKDITKNKLITSPKRERSLRKSNIKNKQEPLDISRINIDASSLNSGKGACAKVIDTQSNSTPITISQNQGARVKSIMKNSSTSDETPDSTRSPASSSKPKKRNKSVSFMLDDNEEVLVKRTKSDDAINVNKKTEKPHVKEKKKANKRLFKKDKQINPATEVVMHNMEIDTSPRNEPKADEAKSSQTKKPVLGSSSSTPDSPNFEKKKKLKKTRKPKPEMTETKTETSNSNEITPEPNNLKKLKKKKQVKPTTSNKRESGDGDDEPVSKSRKTDSKPDLAEDLENLSIGDNAHTLSSMLDEMTVVDKDKRKKMKQKLSKNRKQKSPTKEESENTEEVKEKVKWKKRKWNKDKKGEISDSIVDNTVVVENLPINIVLNYKKLLADYFIKYGLIKKVGMAEMYPTEDIRPVFTTTITFNSDGAAELALEENNTTFEGSRIRVKRLLPATVTTLVVRSYGELNDQNISSTYQGFGKIRSIRHLVKGKKTMATTFVEFDGLEAVERALSQKADIRIGGKRVHMSKFEPRPKKKKEKKSKNEDSAADADSEDSND
ncbi:unnamed protein product [Arctia plantaginis]|uniref:RRM domain-containing protein n=1 Tax=Arctia plantaginis TaxID=874455 RepID=A0A8S1BHU7_ARCPL|nr:unnamed protein product [Arctia plantaginis]